MSNKLLFVIAVGLIILPSQIATGAPQDKEQSSRRETAIIKKIEDAGARVYRISAADTSREISFNLSSKPIGDEQLKEINSIGEVIWLNLAGTKISDEGLKHLKGMPLKKLHLERTKVGDAGMEHIASIESLEYLNIYDTQVSNKSIKHLKKLKSLKKLYVWKSKINEKGIDRLQKQLPDAEIVGELKLAPIVVEEPKPKKKEEAKKEEAKKEESKKENVKPASSEKEESTKQKNPEGKKV